MDRGLAAYLNRIARVTTTASSKYPSRFLAFIEPILRYESGGRKDGGHVLLADGAGWTQWGITERYNPNVASKIRAGTLTREEAMRVYYDNYYKATPYVDGLPSSIAFIMFDTQIHGSRDVFIQSLQRLLNREGGENLQLTGRMDSATFGAVQRKASWVGTAFVRALNDDAQVIARQLEERRVRKAEREARFGDAKKSYFTVFLNRVKWRADKAAAYA